MNFSKAVTFVTLMGAVSGLGLYAQAVISAKAGVIHYVEGDASIKSGSQVTPVEIRTGGRYSEVKEGQELSTAEGRAEVLLTPGVFLRMGENSAVKMISSRLSDTRLELLRGVALVEVAEISKENAVTVLAGDASVSFTKMALVSLDRTAGIRVYKGETQVTAGGAPQVLREGREMQFSAGNAIAKFDAKQGDPLYRWANRRAEYIAMANIASANMARQSYGSSMMSGYPVTGGWFYNSYYGMMTYLPMGNGLFRSPFGYSFFSPLRVRSYYNSYVQAAMPQTDPAAYSGGGQNRTWNSDLGYYNTMSRSAGAVSLPAPSAGAAASAPAAAPAARGAETGTSRGGGSGRGGQ